MTVGLHIAIYLNMPPWLEATGMITPEQWVMFNDCLNFTASLSLH